MTLEQIERKVAMMQRHAILARTDRQSLALAFAVGNIESALGKIQRTTTNVERITDVFESLLSVIETQVGMWRSRVDGKKN